MYGPQRVIHADPATSGERPLQATAERLTLHKNSVQYRVRKAEEGLGRPVDMKRQHTPEQIIRKLAEGEKLLGEGRSIGEVARHLEITESTQ